MSRTVSWIHFGDLHLTGAEEQNYRDFLTLIDEANRHMGASIDFALLPGDNADDGEEDEYRLVSAAVARCRVPVHAITGDHDMATGSLALFRQHLSNYLYRSFGIGGYRFIFLNSVAQWRPPEFGLGRQQMMWLRDELSLAFRAVERAVVFMHAYPSEHGTDAAELSRLFRANGVLLIEMGHTHYNELANDGNIVYATTRSTGQIEEGPAGFSVATVDDGVVSWKFKPIGEWPLVMVTSPCDQRLIIDPANPAQVVRGSRQVRARVWGDLIKDVTLSIDCGQTVTMEPLDDCTWEATPGTQQIADGSHVLAVRAQTTNGQTGEDSITIYVNQQGKYDTPARQSVDYENALGEWPEKHILGTQLGPNESGHPWPPQRKRERVTW
jgi:Icc protein